VGAAGNYMQMRLGAYCLRLLLFRLQTRSVEIFAAVSKRANGIALEAENVNDIYATGAATVSSRLREITAKVSSFLSHGHIEI
jgi:hypothetical protein